MYQLISSPTRITQGSETIIDLFITNEPTRYIEVGCRNCCLGDHQLIYGIRKEKTDNKMTNDDTKHTVSAVRSFCKRTYTGYPGTSLMSLMTLRIDGTCGSYFSTRFWMSMPPCESTGKGKIKFPGSQTKSESWSKREKPPMEEGKEDQG